MEKTWAISNVGFSKISKPQSLLFFSFRSSLRARRISSHNFSNHKLRFNYKTRTLFPVISAAAAAANYGGWDELELSSASTSFDEMGRFRNFLVSIGIDDPKHVIMFFLGVMTSLAICRVRVSSIAVFPVSLIVFVVGFSLGTGSGWSRGGLNERNRLRNVCERMKRLVGFLSELDGKMSDLRRGLEAAMGSSRVETKEMRRYVEIVESVRVGILPAKDMMEASIVNHWQSFNDSGVVSSSDGDVGFIHGLSGGVEKTSGHQAIGGKENDKMNRHRRDLLVFGVDFVRVLAGGLFLDNSILWRQQKVKESVKPVELLKATQSNNPTTIDTIAGGKLPGGTEKTYDKAQTTEKDDSVREVPLEKQDQEQDLSQADVNCTTIPVSTKFPIGVGGLRGIDVGADTSDSLKERAKHNPVDGMPANEKKPNGVGASIIGKRSESSRLQSNNNHLLLDESKLSYRQTIKKINPQSHNVQTRQDLFHDRSGNDVGQRLCEPDTRLIGQDSNEMAYDSALSPSMQKQSGKQGDGNEIYASDMHEELVKSVKLDDDKLQSEGYLAYPSLSSTMLEDEKFKRLLKEANHLLKQARQCLVGQVDEKTADSVLYKSAELLSRAITMKPKNLKAVGQLGNTFLLHGELKLKISKDLRTSLSRTDGYLNGNGRSGQLGASKTQFLSKDRLASILVDVCEECEDFLVEAGRKYRMALSIDENDGRALYNWGLALSYRAQLIADIGPEAAADADKIYVAAIDKFDALMSKSNLYTSDALFRWGQVLQLRSYLRPNGSKEKLKLLQQAKRLFEDSFHLNSENFQVREALSSCIAEINQL